MLNLVIMLLSTMNSETLYSNNYRIAKYMLEHLREIEDVSITELAKKCYVSNSSISRFCRDIGLEDFNALRLQVAKYHVVHMHTLEKFKYRNHDIYKPIDSFVDSVTNNLLKLKNSLQEIEIQKLVEDIFKYQSVASFGYLQSQNIALDLQYDLQTSGKTITTFMKFREQINYLKEADDQHLIIIFSQSGSYFKRLDRQNPFLQNPYKKKPKIYMITANQDLDLPYVDAYIRFQSDADYASNNYPLMVIVGLICQSYAKYYIEHQGEAQKGVY